MGLLNTIDRPLAVTSVAANIDFGVAVGAYSIINQGTNDVWCKENGTPTAVDADGTFRLKPNQSRSIPDTGGVKTIGVISAGGTTSTVHAVGTQAKQC